jgi:hypothetical protein
MPELSFRDVSKVFRNITRLHPLVLAGFDAKWPILNFVVGVI